jgi:hypothetical protein
MTLHPRVTEELAVSSESSIKQKGTMTRSAFLRVMYQLRDHHLECC